MEEKEEQGNGEEWGGGTGQWRIRVRRRSRAVKRSQEDEQGSREEWKGGGGKGGAR